MIYFSSKSDLKALEEGIKLAKKLNRVLMMPNFRYNSNLGGNIIIADNLQVEEEDFFVCDLAEHTSHFDAESSASFLMLPSGALYKVNLDDDTVTHVNALQFDFLNYQEESTVEFLKTITRTIARRYE